MNIVEINDYPDICLTIKDNKIAKTNYNKDDLLTGILTYDTYGFYILEWTPGNLKAKPSIAGFVKISEDEMVVLCKHHPAKNDASSLLVTDFQGWKANDMEYMRIYLLILNNKIKLEVSYGDN